MDIPALLVGAVYAKIVEKKNIFIEAQRKGDLRKK